VPRALSTARNAGLADQFQLFFTRCRAPRASRM